MPISTLRPTHVGHFALILPLFVTLLALGWDSASVHAATNQPDQVHGVQPYARRLEWNIQYPMARVIW